MLDAWRNDRRAGVTYEVVPGAKKLRGKRRRVRAAAKSSGTRALVAAATTFLGMAGPAAAQLPQQSGNVNLMSQANVQIDGAATNDWAGNAVAPAGDVNGDGRGDVIVGAPRANNNGRLTSGSAYVIFGQLLATSIDLSNLADRGFRIDGAAGIPAGCTGSGFCTGDMAGYSVAGAGDMNGDGLADVIVGAPKDSVPGRDQPGGAFVIFGKRSTATVDLASLGSGGFRIDGASNPDGCNDISCYPGDAGESVGGAGDVNGDGPPDVVVGAPLISNNGRVISGSAYVVFGKASATTVDLQNLGANGFRIDGAQGCEGRIVPQCYVGDMAGQSVAGAGDFNGDGRGDFIVGAPNADSNNFFHNGAAFVVYGKTSSGTVDLAALGQSGARINGARGIDGTAHVPDNAGESVAGAGDLNHDGHADVIIGAPLAGDTTGYGGPGAAFVVYGTASNATMELASLGSGGYRIDGARINDDAGRSVSGPGDVNSDGYRDLIVSAPGTDYNGQAGSGSTYVVYGMAQPANVSLATIGTPPSAEGFRIDGARHDDEAGEAAAAAGDFNGDRRADVLVGAKRADNNGRNESGSAYVVYGFGTPFLGYKPSAIKVCISCPISRLPLIRMVPSVRRTGQATFTVSPRLPRGLRLDPATGVIAGTPSRPQPATTYRVTMTDLAGQATAPIKILIY